MKNMKLMLTAFAAVLMMSTAFAQAPQRGADRGDRMMTMMTKQLDLSEEQVTKITAIQKEFREEMRALRSGAGADSDRDAMRAQMQKVGAEQENAIKAVLNPEQLTKWEAIKAERGQARPRGANRPDMNRPTKDRPSIDGATKGKSKPMQRPQKPRANKADKMQKALGLSDSQATELKTITKAHHADMKALKADGAKKRALKKAAKKHTAAVKDLLTPEQFEKWSSMKEKKKGKVKQDILK